MGHKFWTLGLLCGLAALAGCANPPAQPRGESEALARSRMLLARIDQLEADLHSEATAIDTLAVLQQRHGEAVQVACRVTDEHVSEMHRLLVAQTEKRKEKAVRSRHRRVAALGRASHGPLSMR
jgi:hypothetical protein